MKRKKKFDIDDWLNLSLSQRAEMDNWLESIGGRPTKTKCLTFSSTENKVTATEYIIDSNSKNYTVSVITGEIYQTYTYEEDPPIWGSYF